LREHTPKATRLHSTNAKKQLITTKQALNSKLHDNNQRADNTGRLTALSAQIGYIVP